MPTPSLESPSGLGTGTTSLTKPSYTFVSYNPYAPSKGGRYQDFAEAHAALQLLPCYHRALQFDNTRTGMGASLSFDGDAEEVTLVRNTLAYGDKFEEDMVGQNITLDGAEESGNNGVFEVTEFVDKNTIKFSNAGGADQEEFVGSWLVAGGDGETEVVIPEGEWDMTQVEWYGTSNPTGSVAPMVVSFTEAYFHNLRKISGQLTVINNNMLRAPIRLTTSANLFIGSAPMGDFVFIQNDGDAPFIDATTELASGSIQLRLSGVIRGATPAIDLGDTPNLLNFNFGPSARVHSNMIIGTNTDAVVNAGNIGAQNALCYQDPATFAGSITHGMQSANNLPRIRRQMFPPSFNQAAPIDNTVAFDNSDGLGHNGVYTLTPAAPLAQDMPTIRATSLAINIDDRTVGSLNSTGISVSFYNAGTATVTLTAAGTETIAGAATFALKAGMAASFISDGVSNWIPEALYPGAPSSAYTPTNVTPDRAYDADTVLITELADVVGTLIADLQARGLLG
jgi:hypothetical protein